MGLKPRAARPDPAAQLLGCYGFHFPEELFAFWEFCREHAPEQPAMALHDAAEIILCGPFDVLAGKLEGKEPRRPMVMHWRFYLDPPELFTLATGHTDGLHWGYWFDAPGRLPPTITSYHSADAYEIHDHGPGLFAVFAAELRLRIEGCRENIEDDPPYAGDYRARIERIEATLAAMTRYRNRTGLRRPAGPAIRRAETFDRMGLWVDDDPGDLVGPPRALWKRAHDRGDGAALLEIARSALAAGRPGAALLICRAIWTFEGSRAQHADAAALSARIYEALDRPALAAVSRAQLEHRDQPSVDALG